MNNVCNGETFFIYLSIFKKIITVIQIIAPILGIISSAIIFIQLMSNPDDKKLPKKLKTSLKALAILFFIPLLVRITINLVGDNSSYSKCLEDEELKSLSNYSFKDAKYIEIDDDRERTSIITDPKEYAPGEKKPDTPSNSGNTTSQGNAIYFLNVGASTDCIIIQDSGKFGLIDTSYESKGKFIVNQLKKLGATQLDFVMITHPHVDHVGSYSKVMDTFPVKTFYTKADGTKYGIYKNQYKKMITKANKKHTKVCDVKKAECQNFSLGNISFKLYNTSFVYSSGLSYKNKSRLENGNSIAAVATINNKRIYFTGDIGNYFGYNQETKTARAVGDIDVYKVAHHGFTSFNNNQSALNYIKPEYAVVTNNRSNSKTAIKRIKKANSGFIKAYYTTEGTVTLRVDTNGSIKINQ